ncbi:hypothetical protein ACGFJ7_18625 [Actinoplanes sp. NPDC048988]|uniref:hypothetical protein n=1 Tax=Actinoplanes sp. NPDC048988 TaxID=3363901 RepID=UPI00371F444C
MTPNYDNSSLFLAPSSPRDTETGPNRPAADHRAEAMRALRHPFAVRPEAAAARMR